MKRKTVIHHIERHVSFWGSLSSIAGLLMTLPAALVAYQAGKNSEKKKNDEENAVAARANIELK